MTTPNDRPARTMAVTVMISRYIAALLAVPITVTAKSEEATSVR